MKRLFALLAGMLLLTACAAAPIETVSDTVPPQANDLPIYTISLSMPEDVSLQTFAEGMQQVYTQNEGNYEVITEVLLGVGIEDALRSVTGQSSEELTVLKTERFGMPEYRASFYTMSEQGGRMNRTSILYDGAACYCITFSAPEALGAEVQSCMQEIFSSLGLYIMES